MRLPSRSTLTTLMFWCEAAYKAFFGINKKKYRYKHYNQSRIFFNSLIKYKDFRKELKDFFKFLIGSNVILPYKLHFFPHPIFSNLLLPAPPPSFSKRYLSTNCPHCPFFPIASYSPLLSTTLVFLTTPSPTLHSLF